MVGKEESYSNEGQNDINPRSEAWGLFQGEFLSLNSPILGIDNRIHQSSLHRGGCGGHQTLSPILVR